MIETMPKSWNKKSKPHLFCTGCGHAVALKQLGFLIDEMKIQDKIMFGIDIGCSLLAWNFFNIDTFQTHHGRTTPVMVGYKMAKQDRITIGYMGDGGGYAIGLQSLLHAAFRNDPITLFLINNENYAMTGGQMAPTTELKEITTTTPEGKPKKFGPGFRGPELVKSIANKSSFIARSTISKPDHLKIMMKKAIDSQINKWSFSFLEILSICPTNWKTNSKESLNKLKNMEEYYKIGEIINEE